MVRRLAWVAVLAACSFDASGVTDQGDGDGGVTPDAAVTSGADAPPPGTPDAAPADTDAAPVCTAPTGSAVGAPCTGDSDCGGGPDEFCLDETGGWPGAGYCTRVCSNDGACGADARCSAPIGDAGTRVCFATCCGAGDCGRAGMACSGTLAGSDLGFRACLPGDPTAGDGDPCGSFGECAPSSVCSDNPFESPGGYCVTIGCTLGDDSTCAPGGDGVCVDADPFDGQPAICVDRCSSTGDCRASDGYECTFIAIGVQACIYDHRDVGAACGSDSACGDPPWECVTDDGFPGGYCGATGCTGAPDTCPGGAFCAGIGGDTYCIEPCTPGAGDLDCRFIEGYECADFGSGFFGCVDLDELG